jgi:predicted Zn-dependent protease
LLLPYPAEKPPHPLLNNPATYIRAGLLNRAQELIDRRRDPVPGSWIEIGRGDLLLLRGQHEQAIKHLKHGLELQYAFGGPIYLWGCESLADALGHVGRQVEAVEALETCRQDAASRLNEAWATFGNFKMSMDLHLADLYRQVGRIANAQTIEQRVRQRLALADPDYFLLQRLNNR